MIDEKPPFEGNWVKREEVVGGLDNAYIRSLMDICYKSLDKSEGWVTGITSDKVQYWIRQPM